LLLHGGLQRSWDMVVWHTQRCTHLSHATP